MGSDGRKLTELRPIEVSPATIFRNRLLENLDLQLAGFAAYAATDRLAPASIRYHRSKIERRFQRKLWTLNFRGKRESGSFLLRAGKRSDKIESSNNCVQFCSRNRRATSARFSRTTKHCERMQAVSIMRSRQMKRLCCQY